MIRVEVVYALPETAHAVTVEVNPDASVGDAIRQSGILEHCPGIDLASNPVGRFGTFCKLDDPLADGDRVEIYRPLRMDPKQARRRRAAAKRRD